MKTIALLTSTHTILLAESYVYTYVFIAIPCVLFFFVLNKQEKYRTMDYVYAVLFAGVFTIPPFVNIQSGVLVGIYVCWIGMLVLISLEEIVKIMKRGRRQ